MMMKRGNVRAVKVLGPMAGDDAKESPLAPPPVDGEGVNSGTNYYDESSSKSVEIYVSAVSSTTDGLLTFKSEDLESSTQLQSFLNQGMPSSRKRMKMTLTALPEEESDCPSTHSCPESPTVPGKMKRFDAREARLQKLEDAHIRRNQKGNTDEEDEDSSDSERNSDEEDEDSSDSERNTDEEDEDSSDSDLRPKESPPSSPGSLPSSPQSSEDPWSSDDEVTLDWTNKLELMPDDDDEEKDKWHHAFPEIPGHGLWVRRVLYKDGLRLRPEWVASLVPNLSRPLGGYTDICQILFRFMDSEISKSSKPILHTGGALSSKEGRVNFFMLQVEEVVDITEQMKIWFPNKFSSKQRYRLLSLTDGAERVQGFEYEPLGKYIMRGSKLAIHQTTIVGCEGLLKLVRKTCQLKGFPEQGDVFKVSTQLADRVKDGGAFLDSVKKSYEQWVQQDSSNGPGQISNGKASSGIASGADSPLSGQEATQDDLPSVVGQAAGK